MSGVAVSQGQTVSQGQVIGYAGSSGVSTGPHLHFEIAVDGALHNPLGYFSGYTIWDQA
jgi:murein DD-endopeptidase MepM/ murein hydrolase activator NlpD